MVDGKFSTSRNDLLRNMIRRNIKVRVYMVNGFQMTGRIIFMDDFTLTLEKDAHERVVVFVNNISTIAEERRYAESSANTDFFSEPK